MQMRRGGIAIPIDACDLLTALDALADMDQAILGPHVPVDRVHSLASDEVTDHDDETESRRGRARRPSLDYVTIFRDIDSGANWGAEVNPAVWSSPPRAESARDRCTERNGVTEAGY